MRTSLRLPSTEMRFLDAQILTKAKVMNKIPPMTPPMQPSSISEETLDFEEHEFLPCGKRCKVAKYIFERFRSFLYPVLPYLLLLFNSIPNDLTSPSMATHGFSTLTFTFSTSRNSRKRPSQMSSPTVSIKSLCGPDTTSVRINRNAFA